LKNGANKNAKNVYGWTSLRRSAFFGHIEIVKLLLEFGADTKIKDNDGKTPVQCEEQNCGDLIREHEAKQ
jgi:ankyrin repeat protein